MIPRKKRSDNADAFLPDPNGGPARMRDDLAESLGETFVASATSGEDESEDRRDEVVPEELGGPFLDSPASEEFEDGTDASNPEDAEVEPFPQAVGEPKH